MNHSIQREATTVAGLKPPGPSEYGQKARLTGLSRTLFSLGVMVAILLSTRSVSCVASILSRGAKVNLAWDPSPDPAVVGYRIYYSERPGIYQHVLETGSETSATVVGLCPGVTYYFAATALNASGLESDFSNEASYTVPTENRDLRVIFDPDQGVILKGSGQIGGSYLIMASPDLVNWAVTDTIYLDQSEDFEVVMPISKNWPSCFFQMRPTAVAAITAAFVK